MPVCAKDHEKDRTCVFPPPLCVPRPFVHECECVCVGASKRWGPQRGGPRWLLGISQLGYIVQRQVKIGNLRFLTKGSVSGFLRKDTTPCSEKPLFSSTALPSSVIGACGSPSQGAGLPALSYPPKARPLPFPSSLPISPGQERSPHSKAHPVLSFPPPAGPPYTPQSTCQWLPCFSAFLSPFLESLVFLRPQRVD